MFIDKCAHRWSNSAIFGGFYIKKMENARENVKNLCIKFIYVNLKSNISTMKVIIPYLMTGRIVLFSSFA